MGRKSGPNPQSSSDATLPHTVNLDREVQLTSAMLTLWERQMPELFEYTANKVFFVYNAQNGWSDIVEAYSTQYYPVLKRLEKLGEQLLEVQSRSGETQSGSDEERARAFDTIAQPLSAEFAEILQSATTFLPNMP